MIEIHAFVTPNSLKVVIAAEELGLSYDLRPIDLRRGEQRGNAFRELNPNGKVPVLIDRASASGHDLVLSESAAILLYLADKEGKLMPRDPEKRGRVYEQLFFHASELSPAFLQSFLLSRQKDPSAQAEESAVTEVHRVVNILDQRLDKQRYVASDDYTIADIAIFGWFWRHAAIGLNVGKYHNVEAWYDRLLSRPAVEKAISKTLGLNA